MGEFEYFLDSPVQEVLERSAQHHFSNLKPKIKFCKVTFQEDLTTENENSKVQKNWKVGESELSLGVQ